MSNKWDMMLGEIVEEYKNHPENFLRQRRISKTVHPNVQSIASLFYGELLTSDFYNNIIKSKMYDSPVGNPYKFAGLPECSPVTIQNAYQCNLLKQHLGIFVPTEVITHIVEIGGGYGNLCRWIKSFGYGGKYTIVDFPEMGAIQHDYLTKLNSIDNVLLSELNMKQIQPSINDTSILIATFSVNEMPIELRESMEEYYSAYDYLFFAYNPFWEEINNMEYFDNLELKLNKEFDIKHFKDKFRKTKYLMCKRRA